MKISEYIITILIGATLYVELGCSGKAAETSLPIRVRVERAQVFNGDRAFAYSGTIEAAESTPLSFGVTGTVSRVLVAEGDFVRRGQLLAELNDATLRNAFEISRAALERADDVYKRLRPMYDNGNLPEIKFVEVQTGLQQAKAAVAIAQKNLDDCKLLAPVEGFVGARSIEPGMNVLPGLTAVSILKIDKVLARVSVSEKEIAQIRKGQPAWITVSALGGDTLIGTVDEIGVVADPIAHTYKVKIGLLNNDNAIKPGMICEVRIAVANDGNGVVVPNEAVRVDETGKTFVFGVDETAGNATRKYVETGRLLDDGIEIRQGLSAGEPVVVAGQQKLVDKAAVQVVN